MKYNGCVMAAYHYSTTMATYQDRKNVTLDKSAGKDLYEISPHCSDNSHTELYATMFCGYALGTPDITGQFENLQNAETYLLNV